MVKIIGARKKRRKNLQCNKNKRAEVRFDFIFFGGHIHKLTIMMGFRCVVLHKKYTTA